MDVIATLFDGLSHDSRAQVVVLGIIGVIVVGAMVTGRPRKRRRGGAVYRMGRCVWIRDRVQHRSGFERWECRRCGVDAFTSDGLPPKECKRALREVGL